MVVSLINNNSVFTNSSTSSASLSFDATGCNFLVAFVQIFQGTAPTSISMSYGGDAMTPVTGSPFGPDATYSTSRVIAFYLKSPKSGTNTLSASWTNASSRNVIAVWGFSGADNVSGVSSTLTQNTNLTVSSSAGSIVVAATASINNGTGIAITSSGGVQDWNQYIGSPTNVSLAGGHVPGASSVSVTFSGQREIMVALSVDPSPTFVFAFNMPMLGM